MAATLGRLADLFAVLGGLILLVIVAVTTTNTAAFILDRIAGLFGSDISGLPGTRISCSLRSAVPRWCSSPTARRSAACRGRAVHEAAALAIQRVVDHAWLALTASVALLLAYWMVLGMLEARGDAAVTSVLGWKVWPFYLPGIAAMGLWALIAASQIFGGEIDV